MDDVDAAIRDRFTQRADTYDDAIMHVQLSRAVASFIGDPGEEDVLDIATGTGLVLRALRDQNPDAAFSMTGVDLTLRMLDVARGYLPEATLIEADAASLPLADRSFDLVTCVCGLHLISDVTATVSEWARALRPGGRAVTATYTYFDGENHYGSDQEAAAECQKGLPADRHSRFDTLEKLKAAIEPTGFRLNRTEDWTDGGDVVVICEFVRI